MPSRRRPVAVVTGAAHGIGLAIARRLADDHAVAAVDREGDRLADADLPDGVHRVVGDIAADPEPWLAEVTAALGTPSVLVNNAAMPESGRGFLDLPMPEVRRSLETTLVGTWGLTRAVVTRMTAAGTGGSVVFISSLHAERVRLYPDYSVAKAGLRMLAKELADELGPHGIRVNSVSPGAIDTWSDQRPGGAERRAATDAIVPLGRMGTPDDVAAAVAFLADPAASGYVTGADLRVDGGLDQFNWLHHLGNA